MISDTAKPDFRIMAEFLGLEIPELCQDGILANLRMLLFHAQVVENFRNSDGRVEV